MKREFFKQFEKKHVKLILKPHGFRLDGTIDALFEDCFQFTTKQATSYVEYDAVMSIQEWK
jgi:hypothetical protein